MPRVIAGVAGGRRLAAPAGAATRPTGDRVREALFSALGELSGARVLDLFAGSGALGLEAASRGAAQVTLVESAPAALRVLRANVQALGLPGVGVVAAPVLDFLATHPGSYDLVLADPPYALDAAPVLAALSGVATGRVVVERARGSTLAWPTGFAPDRERSYGRTTLWYGRAL